MNCFNHPNIPAVGICKACGKGLCCDCTADLGHGLACKGRHESEVENLNMIISKNTKIFSSARIHTMLLPMFLIFTGSVFTGFGYFSKNGVTDFAFILGIGFLMFGVSMFARNLALFGKNA
jgi:hypothetical protein